MLVHGANFTPDAQVYYNHASVPTLYINDHTLQITLSADLLTESGTGGLEVTNGGGAPAFSRLDQNGPELPDASKSSVVVGFTVRRPGKAAAPALESLAPASVISGSASIWLTLTGHNFSTDAQAQSVARWNGLDRSTVVVDANTVLMLVTELDLNTPGLALITVQTPGTGESQALSFRVRLPGEKPVPAVSGVVLAGWTVYVNGSDFDPMASIRFNGAPRATVFLNSDQLAMTLTPADHSGLVTVFNPGPGGGLSNELAATFNLLFFPLIRH